MDQKSNKKILNVPILKTTELTKDFYEIIFSWPEEAKDPLPGEFMTIGNLDSQAPLLRRPFAFSDFDPQKRTAAAIIQRRGEGSKIILNKKEGDILDILGPLGNGFNTKNISSKPICIGGGIGIGPILFLYNHLKEKGKEPILITGFRSKSLVPQRLCLDKNDGQVLCTDDGSQGFSGNVMDYLKSIIPSSLNKANLFCCGPEPMLVAVAGFAKEKDIPCIVSIEEIMACGVGACQGCSVPSSDGETILRACKEGPAFDSREILWN